MPMTKKEVNALVTRVMKERKFGRTMRDQERSEVGYEYAGEFIRRVKRKHLKRVPPQEAVAQN